MAKKEKPAARNVDPDDGADERSFRVFDAVVWHQRDYPAKSTRKPSLDYYDQREWR